MADSDASKKIDKRISELGDWRGEVLSEVRGIIRTAVPDVIETMKWSKPSNPDGVPVWESNGGICTGEAYKAAVKLTFFKGASLDDPAGLFNSSLDGNTRRAIDIKEGDKLDKKALAALFKQAAALNDAKR
jgi:hypothetical protein